jgi:hypothetical protein
VIARAPEKPPKKTNASSERKPQASLWAVFSNVGVGVVVAVVVGADAS